MIMVMYQSIPKPPIPPPPQPGNPGHFTRVKLHTVGNLTQNEARPVGHLTFGSKRLSAVRSKRISQFFDSAGEPPSWVIALVDSTWVFLLLSFYCQRTQASEDARLARRQHYRAVRIAEKISSVCKVRFLRFQ